MPLKENSEAEPAARRPRSRGSSGTGAPHGPDTHPGPARAGRPRSHHRARGAGGEPRGGNSAGETTLPRARYGRASPDAPRRRRPGEGAGTAGSLLTPCSTHNFPSPFPPHPQQGLLTILLPAAEETAPCEAGRGGRGSRRRGNESTRRDTWRKRRPPGAGSGLGPIPRDVRPNPPFPRSSPAGGRLRWRPALGHKGLVCRLIALLPLLCALPAGVQGMGSDGWSPSQTQSSL